MVLLKQSHRILHKLWACSFSEGFYTTKGHQPLTTFPASAGDRVITPYKHLLFSTHSVFGSRFNFFSSSTALKANETTHFYFISLLLFVCVFVCACMFACAFGVPVGVHACGVPRLMPGIILSKLIWLSLTAEILSPLAEAESQVGHLPPDVYVSFGDPQCSPDTWAVSALTMEPPPQAQSFCFCCFCEIFTMTAFQSLRSVSSDSVRRECYGTEEVEINNVKRSPSGAWAVLL